MNPDTFEPASIDDEQPGSVAYQLSEAEADALAQDLLKESVLGDAAQAFVQSELGREMIRRANDIVMDAALDLVQIPAADTQAIINKQVEARAAALFRILIEQITSEGDQAHQTLVAMIEADGRNRS
jgi:hypothetical protein